MRYIMRAFWLLFGAPLALSQGPPVYTAQTACGDVSGAVDVVPFLETFAFRWSGIPYAAPPTGSLRWQRPAPALCPWSGVANGSILPPPCVQPSGAGTEDCLFVNVHAPLSSPDQRLPVLVYFHGGNLIDGNVNVTTPFAVVAAATHSLVVNVAYRLGVLGWLATDDLAGEQGGAAGNYGLHDAIEALKWIQANIGAFGGNASAVTLFGQSSGGTLILALMASPAAEGLFQAAYSMSGSPNITMDAGTKWAQDAPIVDAVGCGAAPTPAGRLACLRALPATTLARAMPKAWDTPNIWGWRAPAALPPPAQGGEGYAGIVHVDGQTITRPFPEALAAGVNGDALLILSNMAAEPDRGPNTVVRGFTPPEWDAAVTSAFAGWPSPDTSAQAVLTAYAAEAAVDPQLAFDAIVTDYGLTCSDVEVAVAAARAGVRRAPTYLLYNAWPSTNYSVGGGGMWPYHGLDLVEAGMSWSSPPSSNDLTVAAMLQRLLKDVANGGGGPLPDSWGWPAVTAANADAPPTMVLALNATDWPWPGGGMRVERSWRAGHCSALVNAGLTGRGYWWCD